VGRFEIRTGSSAFSHLNPAIFSQWSQLAERESIFQTPEWQTTWLKYFGRGRTITTILEWEGGDLVGLYNLIGSTSPWRALRPVGVGPSDYLGPVGFISFESLQALAEKHFIDLHQLPSDSQWVQNLPVEPQIEQASCYVRTLPATYDEFLKSLSKNAREDVKRKSRILKNDSTQIVTSNAENLNHCMDSFFELHKLRWKSRGLPGAFMTKGEAFQKEWMTIAQEKGWLNLKVLTIEGNDAGIIYSMKFGPDWCYYQAGMRPEFEKLSPGTILIGSAIETAINEGLERFDFMRGTEPYKKRWQPDITRINYRLIFPPQNLLHRTGKWWNEAAWRVESRIRDRVEGKSLISKRATKNATDRP
jgi:CelD/BcsL family acetyltransferase involved in cellulose biosynthesis